MQEIWINETHTDGYQVRWRINEVLHSETTPFQKLAVVETVEWGKALVLDGNLQMAERDEFIYHEMIAHVVMNGHPNPQNVLIVGGGDGGTLREIVKHPCLKHVDMVEIDRRVVEVSRLYFPEVARAQSDSRVNLQFADGVEYARTTDKRFDVVIVDSTDPGGPSEQLFSMKFYQDVYGILQPDGMIVVQSESPFFFAPQFEKCYKNLQAVYPIVEVYLASIPTYVSGPWSFTIGSKKYSPCDINNPRPITNDLKYYNLNLHKAAFYLPQFVNEMLHKS